MDESFYFALLRISIAQILKANGFDKCKPSTLNVMTDLYLQTFQNAIRESLKCSNMRTNSNSPELQDITQALINISIFKANEATKIHDEYYEESRYNTKSIEAFYQWCKKSEPLAIEKKLNEVPNNLIKNLIEKRKLDIDDGESDLAKRKRKHKERQEFYNQLKLNDDQRHRVDEDELDEDVITAKDKLTWLNYLIEKDLKLGHDLKFLHTDPIIAKEFLKFQNNYKFHPVGVRNDKETNTNWDRIQNHLKHLNKTDHIVGEVSPEEVAPNEGDRDILKSLANVSCLLPYNLKYDENLLEEDLTKLTKAEVIQNEEEGINDQHRAPDDEVEQTPNELTLNDGEINNDGLLIDDTGIGGENSLIFM